MLRISMRSRIPRVAVLGITRSGGVTPEYKFVSTRHLRCEISRALNWTSLYWQLNWNWSLTGTGDEDSSLSSLFEVCSYRLCLHCNLTTLILKQRCLHHSEQNDTRIGLHLTIPGVFCLFLFRMLRWYLMDLEFFCFFRAKSVDRWLIGRIKIMKEGKTRLCTARWDP